MSDRIAITFPPETPYLERHAAFQSLWADALAAAERDGSTVRNLGGNRIEVVEAVASALSETSVQTANGPVTESEQAATPSNAPAARKAPAKKSTARKAAARKKG